jgi:hypothetical protein
MLQNELIRNLPIEQLVAKVIYPLITYHLMKFIITTKNKNRVNPVFEI